MLKIGLTGGIGSGKSTVAQLFAELKVPVIDADTIVREFLQPGQPAFAKVVEHFGNIALAQDGTLDKKYLRGVVFVMEHKRKWLEQLLHPLVVAEIGRRTQQLQQQQPAVTYCILVIPLLYEVRSVIAPFIDRVLVVKASFENQIKRATMRDQTSAAEVTHILKAQTDSESRLKHADDIIDNDGTLEELRAQVMKLHEQYSKSGGAKT